MKNNKMKGDFTMSHANDANLNNAINVYIANIGVGYIKLHNLHWNVIGPQFKAVHEYLESLYDAFADVLDETAELLKMLRDQALAIRKAADAHDCFGVANLMEDHVTNYAKQIWFLRSMLA